MDVYIPVDKGAMSLGRAVEVRIQHDPRQQLPLTIPKPVFGKWTEASIQVGGGQTRIRSGEALDDIFIHAGKTGEKI
ncbi:MAG: hypothetical protein SCALA701_12300 [Candidatus Scalindua sp.]|nr:MAG: hypothetical protein SCALA701_12300 [Candidatus Scalindua sp.]